MRVIAANSTVAAFTDHLEYEKAVRWLIVHGRSPFISGEAAEHLYYVVAPANDLALFIAEIEPLAAIPVEEILVECIIEQANRVAGGEEALA